MVYISTLTFVSLPQFGINYHCVVLVSKPLNLSLFGSVCGAQPALPVTLS